MREKLFVAEARQLSVVGRDVFVEGWVRTRRDSKAGLSFIELNDGSCLGNLQIVASGKLPNYAEDIKSLPVGSSIRAEGRIEASPAKGQLTELQATKIDVIGLADPQHYVLQKKRHSFEFLRTIAHLRPRTNTFGAVARVRNAISCAIHDFFQREGFIYVHTPIITTSDCEGAGEMFRVTVIPPSGEQHTDNAKQAARDVHGSPAAKRPSETTGGRSEHHEVRDFFGRPAYLTVSGQLEAEIYATSLGKVYTFGPTFRAENSNTSRHLAEFWMVEPEMAFYDLDANMQLAERFVQAIVRQVLETCPEDMEFFNLRIEPTLLENLEKLAREPFERMSYTEAIRLLEKSDQPFQFPAAWGRDLQSEHERYLTETAVGRPVILYDYPAEIKPFYMRLNDDGRTVRAMDLLVWRVGEIIGGSQREERYDVLLRRMQQQGLDPDDYWWYLDLRRFGTVPHSGFGLGLERTVQLITGMANIRDCIPFPRTPGSAEF